LEIAKRVRYPGLLTSYRPNNEPYEKLSLKAFIAHGIPRIIGLLGIRNLI
jgi:hypothetical protein